jgi:hypothetical protein
MVIDRDHIALTAMYVSLTALIISVINAVVSWTLTARNNPLRNDNLRAEEAAYADGVGVRLCCVNSIWILLTRDGKHLPQRWHIPLEDSLERIEMFLMGLSVSSWGRTYKTKVDEAGRVFREYRWAEGNRDEANWEIAMSYIDEVREEVIKERRALLPRNQKAFEEAFNRTQQGHWALPVERERRAEQEASQKSAEPK